MITFNLHFLSSIYYSESESDSGISYASFGAASVMEGAWSLLGTVLVLSLFFGLLSSWKHE
jgi:hypothetical protein